MRDKKINVKKLRKIYESMTESERYGCAFCIYPQQIIDKYKLTTEELLKLTEFSEIEFMIEF